jgi:hypothetical protein
MVWKSMSPLRASLRVEGIADPQSIGTTLTAHPEYHARLAAVVKAHDVVRIDEVDRHELRLVGCHDRRITEAG